MTLTTVTTAFWIFLIAMWALVIYAVICWCRDLHSTPLEEETEEDEGGGTKIPVEPDDLGPHDSIDWDEWEKMMHEREVV